MSGPDVGHVYDQVVAMLAHTPSTALLEVEAKAIARRFLYRSGHPIWPHRNGSPFPALHLWATTDAPRPPATLGEARRLLDEITDPARAADWHTWDSHGSPEAAAAAVRALIGYLDPPATPPAASAGAGAKPARRRRTPRETGPPASCACGCGKTVAAGRDYAPGHQQRAVAALADHYFGGSTKNMLAYVNRMAREHGTPHPVTGALRRVIPPGPAPLIEVLTIPDEEDF
ncbi:hypothetical protein [Nocardia sp. NPDC003963]